MTGIGSKNHSAGASGAGDGPEDEGAFHFTDKRRIDPDTGARRDRGTAGEPGADGADAAQPGDGGAIAGSGDGAPAAAPGTDVAADGSDQGDELAAARAEAAERTADLQRLSAEYANYRKRTDREKQQVVAAGKSAVVSELLTVLDDIDRADEHGDLTGGFKTVADKLVSTLTGLGLARFGAVGDEFDPEHHEAVQFDTSGEVDHPTVTTVLRVGYTFDERTLRPAVVLVTGPEEGVASGSDEADDADVDSEAADPQAADGAAGADEKSDRA